MDDLHNYICKEVAIFGPIGTFSTPLLNFKLGEELLQFRKPPVFVISQENAKNAKSKNIYYFEITKKENLEGWHIICKFII